MPAGRPTKYDPKMCERVVALMTEGASKVEVCADLDICFDTLKRWQEEHPEFYESIKTGERKSEAWWQKHGRSQLENRDFNATLWYMNMKNRFGWKDKQEVSGPEGGPAVVIYCPKEEK